MKNKIRKLHFLRLVVRGALLIAACAAYFFGHRIGSKMLSLRSPVFAVIWLSFVVDMILRFFPSRYESMGCQKQFERNYRPTEGKPQLSEAAKKRNLRSVIIVAIVWIALNGVIGALHIAGVLDDAAMLIVMLFFSVCDIICILFYCPFQSLLMKNRCCVNCRIYNWDFAMMFTPAIFVDSLFTWSLFILAIALLIRWEVLYARHPERFSEETNQSLLCANCKDKLCMHKKAIRALARKTKQKIHDLAPVDDMIAKKTRKVRN